MRTALEYGNGYGIESQLETIKCFTTTESMVSIIYKYLTINIFCTESVFIKTNCKWSRNVIYN